MLAVVCAEAGETTEIMRAAIAKAEKKSWRVLARSCATSIDDSSGEKSELGPLAVGGSVELV